MVVTHHAMTLAPMVAIQSAPTIVAATVAIVPTIQQTTPSPKLPVQLTATIMLTLA